MEQRDITVAVGDELNGVGDQPASDASEPRPSKLAPLTQWHIPEAPPRVETAPRRRTLPFDLPSWPVMLLSGGLALIVLVAGAAVILSQPDTGDLVVATPVSEKRVPEKLDLPPPSAHPPVSLPSGVLVDRSSRLNYDLAGWLATAPSVPRVFTFDLLRFDPGSATVPETAGPMLQVLSQILAAYPQARVTITGNGPGSLGIERAVAIHDALLQLATDAGQLSTAAGDSSETAVKLTVKLEMGVGSDLDA